MARVTMRDIAAEVGCHYTTVALALKNSPKVAEETKLAVQKKAEEMGYRPDPYLSALNAYRRNQDGDNFKATLAWLDNHPERGGARKWPGFEEHFQGACDRAKEFGYEVDEIWMHEPNMNLKRLVSILKARGIQGLLLPPQPGVNTHFEFQWDDFCAVAFGYSILTPKLPIVSNHHHLSTTVLLNELDNLGYKRIGLYILDKADERVNRAITGAFLAHDYRQAETDRIPILMSGGEQYDSELLEPWIVKYKPEVIVTNNQVLREWLVERNHKVPEEIGVAYLTVAEGSNLSGIYQNSYRVGRAAIDLIDGMLRRSTLGLQEFPCRFLLEGVWNPGSTVRKIS